MPDELDCSDPFERWHQAWFVAPLELDFGIRPKSAKRHWWRRARHQSPVTSHFRLNPPSLGHLIYLQALDSPILKLGFEDVSLGIPDFICAIRVLRDARWPFTAPIDFSATSGDERLLRAHTQAVSQSQPSPIEAALNAQFIPWWFASQQGPELMDDEGEDMQSLTAPYALAMAVRLLRTGSFSERRVFSMPVSLLRFYASGIAEQEGAGTSFLTKETLAGMQEAGNLPDLTQASEEELYAIALRELGQDNADAWLRERRVKKELEAQLKVQSPEVPAHG